MNIGPDGLDLITTYEDLVLNAYPDPATGAEPYTIGYGHTGEVQLGDTVTKLGAEMLLRDDLARFEDGVTKLVRVPMTQREFDSLVSFAFNVGLGNLKASTLLRKLNMGMRYDCSQEFQKWNKGAGKVMKGLQRRRHAESLVFLGQGSQAAMLEARKTFK
jgi:lysozyme